MKFEINNDTWEIRKADKDKMKELWNRITYGEGALRKSKYTSCFSKNGKFTPLWDLTKELEKIIDEISEIHFPIIY